MIYQVKPRNRQKGCRFSPGMQGSLNIQKLFNRTLFDINKHMVNMCLFSFCFDIEFYSIYLILLHWGLNKAINVQASSERLSRNSDQHIFCQLESYLLVGYDYKHTSPREGKDFAIYFPSFELMVLIISPASLPFQECRNLSESHKFKAASLEGTICSETACLRMQAARDREMERWTTSSLQTLGPESDSSTHVKAAHERIQM